MKKLDKGFYLVTSGIGVVALLLIVFAIGYQIVQRTMGSATAWSEELACIGLIIMTLFALYAVERDDEQLRMELIFSICPKLKPILGVVGRGLNILLSGIIIYSESIFLESVKKRLTPAMKIPLRYIHYLIVAGMVIWMMAMAVQICKDIFLWREKDKEGKKK